MPEAWYYEWHDPDYLCAGSPLPRAMLAVILYRMSGNPAVANAPTFTDAAAGAWYSDAVSWVAESKVLSGYPGGLIRKYFYLEEVA